MFHKDWAVLLTQLEGRKGAPDVMHVKGLC